MSVSIDKITEDFSTLPIKEKIEFLKRVTALHSGKWVELDGKLHFIPEGPPATGEEEQVFEMANREIDSGRGVSLDELKRQFEV